MRKYFTPILIASGFVGFSITMLLYFNILKQKKYTFHELVINRDAIIDGFNTGRINTTKFIIDSIRRLNETILTDSIKNVEIKNEGANLPDTIEFKHLKSIRDSLMQVLNIKNDGD